MADDYARATASPRTISLAGRDYLVGKFTPRDIGDLQAWLKEQIPDPRREAREFMAGMSDEVAKEIWRDAVERAREWPPTIQSTSGFSLLTTTHEGNARMIWVTLRRHNLGFTLDRAREVADLVGIEDINRLVTLAGAEGDGSPKSETTATTAQA